MLVTLAALQLHFKLLFLPTGAPSTTRATAAGAGARALKGGVVCPNGSEIAGKSNRELVTIPTDNSLNFTLR